GDPPEPDDPVINEFVFNHTGADTHEYVEIFGTPNADYSTYAVLQIEGDGDGAGVIDSVHTVGVSDANGLWTTGFLSGDFENGTVTLLLVEEFTGSAGDDLDSDNDGVLDAQPWARIVDDVAVSDGGADDRTYAGTVLAGGFDGVSFTPGGASRIPNGADTDTVDDWMRNDFDGEGLPGFTGTPEAGEALNTPGALNAEGSAPPDSNVIINEVDSDTPGADNLEFVELYDGGDGNTSLDGLVVVFFNGAFDTSYAAFDLDGHTTNGDGYFVLGNEAVSPAPAITFNNGLLQNGQDAVALYSADGSDFPGGTEVTTENLVDAIVYDTNEADDPDLLVLLNDGQPQVNEGGEGSSADDSNQRCPNGAGGARNTDAYVQAPPTPGAANDCEDDGDDDVVIGACGDPATFIHEIQGSGATSPMEGDSVVIEGVVVGDFQNNAEPDDGDLNGFFVQEEDADADGDPATSDGMFVFSGGLDDVSVGQQVRVAGTVDEFGFSGSLITELTDVSDLLICGDAELPTVTEIELPVTDISDFERYEGMYVRFPQELVIAEYFNYDRFGEIVLALPLGEDEDGGRPQQPTAIAEPGADAAAIAEANALRRITLDDGRTAQNPDPAIHPNGNEFTLDNKFRGGDIVQNATGVMDDAFGLYRIQPTEQPTYTPANPRPAAPEDVGGSLTVASFNVLNYFTTIDDGQDTCGPTGGQECRGADTPEELERQRTKIIAALSEMDADVVGLIELENNPGDVPVADLVQGLNDVMGAGTYDYIATGAIGTDAIRQALIYKPATVTPVGNYAILDSSVDPRFDDDRSRPVLAQTFMEEATGGVVTVAVNHLKSKGSPCGTGDDDPQQGSCNLTRTLAAEAMVDWLAGDPTGSGDADFLIIGDLNAYDEEDPIDALVAGGYTDLLLQYEGEFAYSFVFDGQLGYLDHALANGNLLSQVTGATAWHINADEPDILDYDMTFKQDAQDALFEENAYRSSDHDPVIVGLALNGSPVCEAAAPSLTSLWPPNHKFVDIDILDVTDPDGDPITITIDSIFQDEAVDAEDSGNTAPDGMGIGAGTAQVRAERVGTANGRVYYITFTATDGQGGSCSGTVEVGVPISINSTAVGDGPLFDSTMEP
ncbi:MAG: ExeM/NucH family extracellular endonuclease, partial [Chloroflexota bacterium]